MIELHSGLPVEHARVLLQRLPNDGRTTSAETSGEGEFRVTGMVRGRYRIEASKPGYAASALFATLEADTAVVVRLAKGGAISGDVVTNAGAPALNASVFPLVKTAGTSTLRRLGSVVGRVDDRGHYRLYDLPPGDYAVGVTYSGVGTTSGSGVTIIPDNRTPRLVSITSGEEHRDINLTVTSAPARAIEGHIDPVQSSGVVLVTLAPQDQPGIAVAQTLVDKNGRFRFDGVQPGSYSVFAAGPCDARLNGGLGGLLVGDPVFGRTEVSLTHRDEKDVAITLNSGGRTAFRLDSLDMPSTSGACGSSATLRLTAIENWGIRIDQDMEVSFGSAAAAPGVAPARYLVSVRGLPNDCYYAGEAILDCTAGTPDVVSLRVALGAALEGRFLGGGGGDTGGYIALLWPEAPADEEPKLSAVVSDGNGIFSVESLRPGNYRILAASPHEWFDSQWKPDLSKVLPLRLTRGVTSIEFPILKRSR